MNGEVLDLCELTVLAKQAKKEQREIAQPEQRYIAKRRFIFSQGYGNTESVSAWFRILVKRGMRDLVFMIPTEVKKRSILGFSNTSGGYLLCFRNDETISYFTAEWEFQKEEKLWHVTYREHEWEEAPKSMAEFEDCSDSFRRVLKEIAEFANEIDEPFFGARFEDALEILNGNAASLNEAKFVSSLPEKYRRIFRAADMADVFGAMGSWNDCPPGHAEALGRRDDYERLSNELLRQIRINLMYAVNMFAEEE